MKTYLYRVRNTSGTTVGIWGGSTATSTPVLSDPSFSAEVDAGLSDLRVSLALPFSADGQDIAVGNAVDTYCKPDDGPEVQIHGGVLERIERTTGPNGDTVDVTITPHVAQLAREYFRDDAAGTTIAKTWTTTDVSTILSYVVGKIILRGGTFARVHPSSTSVQTSGKTISIQVGSETYLSAIQRVKKLGPGNYYWHVDASGVFWYRNFDSGTNHVLTLWRDVTSLKRTTDLTDVRNVVYFWNQSDADGTVVAFERSAAASTALYGRRSEVVTDSRIDDQTTAEAVTSAYLTEHAFPIESYEAEVVASSTDPSGYPIESIHPGDSCTIRNVASLTDTTFTITRIDYTPTSARLTLGVGPIRRARTLGMSIEEMAEFMRSATDGSIPSATTA